MQIWRCPKCETLNNTEICSICGEKYSTPPAPEPEPKSAPESVLMEPVPTNIGEDSKKEKNLLLLVAVILAVVAVLLISFVCGYILVAKRTANNDAVTSQTIADDDMPSSDDALEIQGKSDDSYVFTVSGRSNASQSADKTELGNLPNENTQRENVLPPPNKEPYEASEPMWGDYKRYVDEENSFSCLYPSWLCDIYTSDDYFFADGESSDMYIMCTYAGDRTPEQALEDYIYSHYGEVDYSSQGDDFYAVRMEYDDEYYYEYSKFYGDKKYSFGFWFCDEDFNLYDAAINEIYADFVKQF